MRSITIKGQRNKPLTTNDFKGLLREISKFVIVTGSYAKGTQTSFSDIDFFIKFRPEDEYNPENPNSNEQYVKEIRDILDRYDLKWGSVLIGSFHTEDTPIPMEFSTFFQIDETNVTEIEILGVKFDSSISIYEE